MQDNIVIIGFSEFLERPKTIYYYCWLIKIKAITRRSSKKRKIKKFKLNIKIIYITYWIKRKFNISNFIKLAFAWNVFFRYNAPAQIIACRNFFLLSKNCNHKKRIPTELKTPCKKGCSEQKLLFAQWQIVFRSYEL